jgi:serine/threonine protein kinase/formylglycine-generating enzyme required for sulfatase activity
MLHEDGKPIELGRGAMGITYKAFDVDLRCPVTLKVISEKYVGDESAKLRFLREARAAARLRHSNVASVLRLGMSGGDYFYAMEFIEGETLENLIRHSGRIEPNLALEIMTQVASGLAAVHKQKLVHRDIKPSNIMVSLEEGGNVTAKIIDLGLAKAVNEPGSQAAISMPGGFVGTPEFASPEQFAGVQVDIRSDLYSLGLVLWEMMTGCVVFRGSPAEVMYQHQHATLPLEQLKGVAQPVVALLEVLLEKDPARRFHTPTELLKAMPVITGAIDGGRTITHENLRLAAPQPAIRPQAIMTGGFEASGHLAVLKPEAGSLLRNRYRLIEDINPANPGHTFHAEDIVPRMRVAVRVFVAEPSILGQIDEEAGRIKGASHPNFVHVFAAGREGSFSFVVLEWLEGFPLIDLLRARRTVTLRETLLLLRQMAPAVDAAREASLRLEMNLRGVFVHFPESFAEPASNVVLHCPLDEWPAFVVKMSLLGNLKELERSPKLDGEQTIVLDAKPQRDVVQLGVLACELLGGERGGLAPLKNVSEKGNEILRDCLLGRFLSAREFCETLSTATVKLESIAPVPMAPELERSTPPRLQSSPEVLSPAAPMRNPPESRPLRSRGRNLILFVAALGAIMLAAGLGWLLRPKSQNPTLPALRGTISPSPTAALVFPPPPQPGKPWSNSLGMRFVSLGEIHIAVWQTRVRDFEPFVQATGYDAVGGMSSAITRNGFKLRTMSWMAPGFQQTPEHPVVGVSWEDANLFCEWLTKKERSEGTLAMFQSYRLPTDHEWSRAIGLEHEQGATPEDRSGKIKNVYPWGTGFPPPNNVANYAGSESREGAPETWMVIAGFYDAFPRTAPVSAFNANANGLHCLGGNVWEWCTDKFENTTNWRVLRGGSWATSRPEELLSSYRRGHEPLFRCDDVGFRCVIATDGAQK